MRCGGVGHRLESLTNPNVIADRVLKAEPKSKPLAVYLAPRADNGLLLLQEHGVASFRTPEACADAVNTFLNWRAPLSQAAVDRNETSAAARLLAAKSGGAMNELEALELFAALGIECVPSSVVTDPDEMHGHRWPGCDQVVVARRAA